MKGRPRRQAFARCQSALRVSRRQLFGNRSSTPCAAAAWAWPTSAVRCGQSPRWSIP